MKAAILIAALAIAFLGMTGSWAQQLVFFRIGTGSTVGTYYPIGGLIAEAISHPPGAPDCGTEADCGVPGLVATAIASTGSVGNIEGLAAGGFEAGLVQSDIAYWAQTGTGLWQDRPVVEGLRMIANLYPETVHLAVRADAGIAAVTDLRGKRVSLGEPGSGTLVDAGIILAGFGLSDTEVRAEYLQLDQAAARMREGSLDALFLVGGYPAPALAQLASQNQIRLIPIAGEQADRLRETYSFLSAISLPAGTYRGQDRDIRTLSVGAQLVTRADQPEDLIHGITRALFRSGAQGMLASGHARARLIRLESATTAAGIPLHPGAERFYREAGVLP